LFLNLCLKTWFQLHYMVCEGTRGQRREPIGRPELAPWQPILKEYAMSVEKDLTSRNNSVSEKKKKRRFLSPEKKFQIFLESQTEKTPVGEILRREGIYSTDLARIRKQVKEAALQRLSARPGPKGKTVPREDYEALKRELEEKERALADQAVELAILRKKTNGGSWER